MNTLNLLAAGSGVSLAIGGGLVYYGDYFMGAILLVLGIANLVRLCSYGGKMNDKKKLDYETILLILDFWLDDWKKNEYKKPPGLKVSDKEFEEYLVKIQNLRGVRIRDYDELRRDILNRIIQKKQKEIAGRQLTMNFLVILVLVFSAWTAYQSFVFTQTVGNKQIELMENEIKSISPLKPTLELTFDYPEDNTIFVEDIAKVITYPDGNQVYNTAEVRFILSNIGRMQTGQISALLESHFTHLAQPSFRIQNIIGESSEYLQFHIRYIKCDSDETYYENGTLKRVLVPEECDHSVSNVSQGWEKFNLTIECPLCLENKTRKFLVYLCIYGDVPIENCLNNVTDALISEYQSF